MKMRYLLAGLLAPAALVLAAPAAAQEYPVKPLRLVIPFPPGGGTDFLGRVVAKGLGESTGWNVVPENRAGAGGTVGLGSVMRAAPDGYEIALGQIDNMVIAPEVYKEIAYDATRDFAPIGIVAETPLVIVTRADSRFKTLKDVVDEAKRQPGALNYASPGAGTITHLAGELFQQVAGIKLEHVPYRGSGPAMADLLGGQVPLMVTSIPSANPQIQAGKVRPLAVTSPERSPAMPDVPTVAESGYKDFDVRVWYGLVAPAKTPQAVQERLNTELNRILGQKEIQDAIAAQGAQAKPVTQAQFRQTIQDDIVKWKPVVKASGAKAE
ncbi:tripartite tricarboxylate transporter substrate binding protein [Orrella sp. JC864]|uniref:Bug family tripartite tricarboxylate transporter substrate binding protein n=1 Tax=Orrella sp. JC864 TaxID=3120298 RepID=UPI0012BCFAEF